MSRFAAMLDGRNRLRRKKQVELAATFAGADMVRDQVCRHRRYRIKVEKNEIGLYRATLTDRHQRVGEKPGFEGICVRELYTFQHTRMLARFSTIVSHRNPPGYCCSLVREWNCDDPFGLISLDKGPMYRDGMVPNQPPLERPRRST